MKFSSLRFGTAGIPLSTEDRNTLDGIKHVNTLGLSAMELEFVHSVNIKKENAPLVKQAAEKNDVALSCHGQYFINLNAIEKEKVEASIKRVLNAADVANACGAFSMTFHSAFYLGMPPEKVYENVKENMKRIISVIKETNNPIWIRPETTGKPTQFGDIFELTKLSAELEQVMPCVDFSHFHARTNGKYNTYEEFSSILEEIEKTLGRFGLENMHIHVAGIEYGEKGEKNHLNLDDSDLNYKDLMKCLRDFKVKGVVISESPNIEGDALIMKRVYER